MKTVHKFRIIPDTPTEMPKGAGIIHIGAQGSEIYAWATVDTDVVVMEKRDLRVYGTGHPLPDELDDLEFAATVMLYGGALVFHVFENHGGVA